MFNASVYFFCYFFWFKKKKCPEAYDLWSVSVPCLMVWVPTESGRTRSMLVGMDAAEDDELSSSSKTRLSARYIALPVLILACNG